MVYDKQNLLAEIYKNLLEFIEISKDKICISVSSYVTKVQLMYVRIAILAMLFLRIDEGNSSLD